MNPVRQSLLPGIFWNILSTAGRKNGMDRKLPPVLLSGHHANIEAWRREQSIHAYSQKRRPDLLKKADLTNKEWNQIRQWKKEWKAQKVTQGIKEQSV